MKNNKFGINFDAVKNEEQWEELINFMIKNSFELPPSGEYKIGDGSIVCWVNPNEIVGAKRRK